jgi:hypothetical protein
MLRAQYDWIVLGGKRNEVAHCTLCGDGLVLGRPAIPVFIAALQAFESNHARCRGTPHSPAAPDARATWFQGRDTGISSLTLYFFFTGTPSPSGVYGAPVDPDDFGRCYRLFNLFPEWLPRLANVCDIFPEWESFVKRWADMTALFEREAPSVVVRSCTV